MRSNCHLHGTGSVTHFFLVLVLKLLVYKINKINEDSVSNNVDNSNLNTQKVLLNNVYAQRWTTDDWAAPAACQNILQSVLIVGTVMRGPEEKYPGLWEKHGEKSSSSFFFFMTALKSVYATSQRTHK